MKQTEESAPEVETHEITEDNNLIFALTFLFSLVQLYIFMNRNVNGC